MLNIISESMALNNHQHYKILQPSEVINDFYLAIEGRAKPLPKGIKIVFMTLQAYVRAANYHAPRSPTVEFHAQIIFGDTFDER